MATALIGYTGFVGSNLNKSTDFEYKYNSKNIETILENNYDLVVSAGVRAEKFLANKYPEKDLEGINKLKNILAKLETKKIVHISTIDVYDNPINVDENTVIDKYKCQPYGTNRLALEEFVKETFEDYLIVRLPALYGIDLKKNFIYDMMTKIPSMIMGDKFNQIIKDLSNEEVDTLKESYQLDGNGNYCFNNYDKKSKERLIEILESINFTSPTFTDSRSEFPFYDLSNLWLDIERAIYNNIKVLNISVEPISARDIAIECFDTEFTNIIGEKEPIKYDIKSIHYKIFNGNNGYLYTRNDVIEGIKNFIIKEGL